MNSENFIPTDVQEFLHRYIPSVGHMEALILTIEEPGNLWTVPEMAARLFVTEAKTQGFLQDLATAGLVVCEGAPEHWRFASADPALAGLAVRTGRFYRERLVAMTGVIRSRPDSARQLADAFRFRKE